MEALMDPVSRNLQHAVWKAGTTVYPESRYAPGPAPAFDQHKLMDEAGQALISQSMAGLVKALTSAGMPQPARQMLVGLLAMHGFSATGCEDNGMPVRKDHCLAAFFDCSVVSNGRGLYGRNRLGKHH